MSTDIYSYTSNQDMIVLWYSRANRVALVLTQQVDIDDGSHILQPSKYLWSLGTQFTINAVVSALILHKVAQVFFHVYLYSMCFMKFNQCLQPTWVKKRGLEEGDFSTAPFSSFPGHAQPLWLRTAILLPFSWGHTQHVGISLRHHCPAISGLGHIQLILICTSLSYLSTQQCLKSKLTVIWLPDCV